METVGTSRFDDCGSDLPTHQVVGVSAVKTLSSIRDWVSSRAVVKNMLITFVAFTIGQQHGLMSGRKATNAAVEALKNEYKPLAAAAPRLNIDEKEMMARFHTNYLRTKANGIPNGIATSNPR